MTIIIYESYLHHHWCAWVGSSFSVALVVLLPLLLHPHHLAAAVGENNNTHLTICICQVCNLSWFIQFRRHLAGLHPGFWIRGVELGK